MRCPKSRWGREKTESDRVGIDGSVLITEVSWLVRCPGYWGVLITEVSWLLRCPDFTELRRRETEQIREVRKKRCAEQTRQRGDSGWPSSELCMPLIPPICRPTPLPNSKPSKARVMKSPKTSWPTAALHMKCTVEYLYPVTVETNLSVLISKAISGSWSEKGTVK